MGFTRLFTGSSQHGDPVRAVAEAMDQALLRADAPVFALVLSTPDYDPSALCRAVEASWGEVLPWAGCTAPGLIHQDRILHQGLVVGVLSSSEVRVRVGAAGPLSQDAFAAGERAARNALSALPPPSAGRHRALLVLPDTRGGFAAQALRGVSRESGTRFAWAGAGAADAPTAVQFAGGRIHSDHVVVVAIDSPAPFGTASAQGWQEAGPSFVVTRAEGANVLELNHEPAFELFRRHASSGNEPLTRANFAAELARAPLALGLLQARGPALIQVPLSTDVDGGIRFRSEIPQGSVARFMCAHRDDLLASAFEAATRSRKAAGGIPGGAFVFQGLPADATGLAADRLAFVGAGLGRDVPVIGCLGAGEISAESSGLPEIQDRNLVVFTLPGTHQGPHHA